MSFEIDVKDWKPMLAAEKRKLLIETSQMIKWIEERKKSTKRDMRKKKE